MFVQWHSRNHAGVPRPAALDDAVAVGGVRRAQHRKWQAAMPKRRTGDLPSVQRTGQHTIPELERQLINVLRGEILPHIIARTGRSNDPWPCWRVGWRPRRVDENELAIVGPRSWLAAGAVLL